MLPLLIVLAGCSSGDPATSAPAAPPEAALALSAQPDVLFVVLDTVRADALSVYGNPRPTSPQVDAIAAAGVRFADVTSVGSWTWPAHASLFTGEPPWVHGAHFAPPEDGGMQMGPDPFHASAMREDLPTLAERFDAAGYRTVALSGNRLVTWDFGLTRGFADSRYFESDAEVVAAARVALADPDPRPLLLFVNLFGAHAPLDVQPASWLQDRPELDPATTPAWLAPYLRLEGKRVNLMRSPAPGQDVGAFSLMRGDWALPDEALPLLRDLYDGEVMAVDYQLHQVVKAWQSVRSPDSVVAVTSDHGEYLGERGMLEHGRTLYPELIAVPLIVSAPGRLPAGRVVDVPVQAHQLHDALLSLSGVGGAIAGRPGRLLDVVHGGGAVGEPDESAVPITAAAWRDHLFASQIGGRFTQGYRYYRVGDEVLIAGTQSGVEYYRLDDDPGHLQNRAGEYPGRVSTLRAAAADAYPESAATGRVDIDAETAAKLEALGYAGH